MSTPRKRLADVARRTLRAVGVRSVTRTVQGRRIQIPIAIGKLTSLLLDSTYRIYDEEDVMEALLRRLRPDDLVFDIGAHHGLHAIVFANVVRTVVAFEPNPLAFEVLKETLSVNGTSNVFPHEVAIGSEAYAGELWGTGSGASFVPREVGMQRSRVTVIPLDDFAARATGFPDVLKIDVEGAEHQVLSGGRRCLDHCRLVCLEVHLDQLQRFGVTGDAIFMQLAQSGFTEIFRRHSRREGGEDPLRIHVIFEREAPTSGASEAR
jgi:FkbM family methyltransferase